MKISGLNNIHGRITQNVVGIETNKMGWGYSIPCFLISVSILCESRFGYSALNEEKLDVLLRQGFFLTYSEWNKQYSTWIALVTVLINW